MARKFSLVHKETGVIGLIDLKNVFTEEEVYEHIDKSTWIRDNYHVVEIIPREVKTVTKRVII